ncbi:hypothetical protein AAGW05_10205 [Arthrobacter sp. LAPM80]|uniref:hypothetical protein n=1 Tax=Arthrobacter sp. LAPM80 TaxID=3141788 RepID=UPI00398B19E2
MGIFSEAVEVERSPGGALLRLRWRGAWHAIAPHPLCWYERRSWWESETRMPPGEGVGAVDTEMWRLQVRREGADEDFTLDVVRYRPGERWRVIKIYDAVDEKFKEVQEGA